MFQSNTTSHNSSINHAHTNVVILEHVPLADKNTFRTGGLARFYCRPSNPHQFAQALQFAKERNLEIFVLGGGANILIHDDGFPGLVIHPALQDITIVPHDHNDADNNIVFIKSGAGVGIDELITWCLQHHILGLEEFSGIPGTVGGAVYINLHYYEFLLEQFLVQATLIHTATQEIITVDKAWFNFGYDQSKLQEKEYFVLDATFQLQKTDAFHAAHAQGRSKEIIRHRHKRYPYQNTCGSFFRNFHPEEVAHTEKKLIFVAYYLDKLGIKGELSVGGATISHQHANMIVCKNGTSADIVNLTLTMQRMVYEEFGIKPQPECQLVGFKKNPYDIPMIPEHNQI